MEVGIQQLDRPLSIRLRAPHEGEDMTEHIGSVARRLLLTLGGLVASGALVLGGPAGVAGAEPGDPGDNEPNPSCFGIPECTIPGFLEPTGAGGGGYANGTAGGAYSRGEAGGGYATGSAGGAFSRGQAGGAWNHTP